ncbi:MULTISPECIES: hypothetical protein [Streptomyces]|uniref:hypothetical protein n=1 Tax=Streptomyces TaxID=1883 RepID=UPI0026CE55AF
MESGHHWSLRPRAPGFAGERLFQQRVSKSADIRLTAVGDHLTAVRIDGSPGIDWRRHYEALTYTPVPVPPEITKGVRAYLDAFGLVFGAFDFGLGTDGRWHWYECNPNGQWAWFPDNITAPITNALADRLQHPQGTFQSCCQAALVTGGEV